jgi:hypothetical protein
MPRKNSWHCPFCKKLHLAAIVICPESLNAIQDKKVRPEDYDRAVMHSANQKKAQDAWAPHDLSRRGVLR